MKAKIIFSTLVGLFLAAFPLATSATDPAPLRQQLGSGCIDWSATSVRASGIGKPAAVDQPTTTPTEILHNARQMALSNLLATVNSIRIDASTRIADRFTTDTAFAEGLIALAGNASVTRQEYLSDGTLQLELTMSLTGGFAQFVLPEEIRQVEAVTAMRPPSPTEGSGPSAGDNTSHTGLIIDATGIDASPALVPVIVDESGEIVYGPAFVSREFAVSRGMSGFVTTLEAARLDPRVGDHPMVARAIRLHAPGDTRLVISTSDAARLRSSANHLDFMKNCRVAIVLQGSSCQEEPAVQAPDSRQPREKHNKE